MISLTTFATNEKNRLSEGKFGLGDNCALVGKSIREIIILPRIGILPYATARTALKERSPAPGGASFNERTALRF